MFYIQDVLRWKKKHIMTFLFVFLNYCLTIFNRLTKMIIKAGNKKMFVSNKNASFRKNEK